MDTVIKLIPVSIRSCSSYIDFEGQRLAEQIFQIILGFFGVAGFIVGYITQQLSLTMYGIGIGFLVSCIFVLPPWPIYRRHPLKWQPNVEEEPIEKSQPQQQPAKKVESKKKR